MPEKKLAMVQDIPGMKSYDGPDGPEMYVTDPGSTEGFKGPRYPLKNIIAAELTDETFEDPYKDPAYIIAEMTAISR